MGARSRRFVVGINGVYTNLDEFMAGQVIHCASASIPAGYLECNGAAVSRATYGTLFAAIGTAYGAGDGATTFNVPDLRGEFIRGADRGRGVDAARAIASAQAGAIESHTHASGMQRGIAFNGVGAAQGDGSIGGWTTGATGATETRPRNVAMVAVIKYS